MAEQEKPYRLERIDRIWRVVTDCVDGKGKAYIVTIVTSDSQSKAALICGELNRAYQTGIDAAVIRISNGLQTGKATLQQLVA